MASSAAPMFKSIQRADRNTIQFTLSPTRVGYANSLVRSIKSYVPTIGFRADMTETGSTSDVKIYRNSTPMSNEMLADRIGLLLIHETNTDGWDPERYIFKLNVKNESTTELRHVTAADFEVLEKKGDVRNLNEEEAAAANATAGEERLKVPNTQFFRPDPVSRQTSLIATLKPLVEGQEPEEIHLEAVATVGIGREHVRFSPICIAAYGYSLDTSAERITPIWLNWLREHKKVDPRELDKDAEKKGEFEREFRTLQIYRSYLVDEKGEPYSYDWTVESAGALDPTTCVYRGCLAMADLCEKYSTIDKGDLPETITIQPADCRMKGFDCILTGVDYTLGNALQTYIDEHFIETEEKGVAFCGFKVPHPLRDEGVLRIGFDSEDISEMAVRESIAAAATGLVELYRGWAMEWAGGEAATYMEEPKKLWNMHAEAKDEEERAARPTNRVAVKKVGDERATVVRTGRPAAAPAAAAPVVVKKK